MKGVRANLESEACLRDTQPVSVARMKPPGLASGEPEDRLREIRGRCSRIALRSMRATALARRRKTRVHSHPHRLRERGDPVITERSVSTDTPLSRGMCACVWRSTRPPGVPLRNGCFRLCRDRDVIRFAKVGESAMKFARRGFLHLGVAGAALAS